MYANREFGVVVRIVQDSNHCAGRVFPSLPQTSKAKQGIVLDSEVEGPFLSPASPQFEKAVRRK
jgi:hypothetical protein